MPVIRRGVVEDLPAIAAIQAASPEASHWQVSDYSDYEFSVAEMEDGTIAGFLVWRTLAPGECEILNVATAENFRRNGIARQLFQPLINLSDTAIFLEVRESNAVARFFYKSMGFQEVNTRRNYYDFPVESAIVMKFHSC